VNALYLIALPHPGKVLLDHLGAAGENRYVRHIFKTTAEFANDLGAAFEKGSYITGESGGKLCPVGLEPPDVVRDLLIEGPQYSAVGNIMVYPHLKS
jgi:hypothetical protein